MSDSDWWDDAPAPSGSRGGDASGSGTSRRAETSESAAHAETAGFAEMDSFAERDSFAGDDYYGSDFAEPTLDYSATPPTPVTVLHLAVGAAAAGLLIGLVVNFFIGGRATGATVAVAAVGWLLAGIVAVLGVARYQAQELRTAATSTFYSPNPSASLLRLAPLVLGSVGVILTSYYIADWVARR